MDATPGVPRAAAGRAIRRSSSLSTIMLSGDDVDAGGDSNRFVSRVHKTERRAAHNDKTPQ